MPTIIGLSGSLRRESFNTRLLVSAARFMPEGVDFEIASIRGVPLYDADMEAAEGIPETVSTLKDRLADASGLLIATPEYNQSIPGVVKNAIDWLSRPPRDIPRVFGALPVALIGATPGGGGTALSQAAWLPILRTLGTRAWFGRSLQVPSAGEKFDSQGLTDEETLVRLEKLVREFAAFATENRRSS